MDFDLPASSSALEIPPIDFRSALNDEQYAAVTAEPGPLLILAGAGSGKTRTLTHRVAYLLSQGARPDQILLLTFTNKAAKEMLHRVEELTSVPSRQFWGGTFHSIGHRLLRRSGERLGLAPNFTILDADEAEALLKQAVESVDAAFFKNKTHPKPKPLSAIISMARNTRASIAETISERFPQHEDLVERIEGFATAYEKRRRAQNVVDYDDLLELWLKLLETDADFADYCRRRFRHVLVDEYQDTNILQARIVDLVGAGHSVMAVGDDAQCIYSWRGANFENIATFPDRHPGAQVLRIETNYRSSPEILELANGVIRNRGGGQGFEKELRASRPSADAPYVIQAMDTREEAQFLVARLSNLFDRGRSPREIAVLYRAHYQALDLQMELSRAGIPYQITSGVRFFEQAHIKDLVAHLRLVYNSSDLSAFARLAALLPKVGPKTAEKLHGLAAKAAKARQRDFIDILQDKEIFQKVPAEARPDWESLALTLRDMRRAADEGSPDEVVELGIEGWYCQYLQGAYANYVNRLEDLKSLAGFAARYEELQDLIAQIALLTSETSDRGVDDSEEAVRLTTVHQAKGLEFDVVFVICAADGLFPIRRSVEAGDTEEERRLFYVAVTRAREELYISYPKMNTKGPFMQHPPSRFLDELPARLYETVHLRRSYGW